MASLYLECGFAPAKIGELHVYVNESEAGATDFLVTITTGQYLHTDISSVLSAYEDFAGDLKDALDAGSSRTYTVTWSQSAGTYTISAGANENFVLDFDSAAAQAAGLVVASGTRMKHVLGFSATGTQPADSQTSDVRPYYYIVSATGAASDKTDDYEPATIVSGAVSMSGAHYAVSGVTSAVQNDFTLTHESKAASFKRSATAAVPWTYQHLWEHARGDEPILIADGTDNTVHYLRADGCAFAPERVTPDFDGYWNHRFLTFMDGRL